MAGASAVSSRTKAAVFAILAGYSWVMTGVHPFSSTSYVLVAVPSVAFVIAYLVLGGLSPRRSDVDAYYRRHAESATLRSVTPWIALLIAAVLFEVIGLLLGGRSTSVPTLSTAIDHLLEQHWERFLICLTWLLAGAVPVLGLLPLRELRER
jgi:phosphate/sulfate permease